MRQAGVFAAGEVRQLKAYAMVGLAPHITGLADATCQLLSAFVRCGRATWRRTRGGGRRGRMDWRAEWRAATSILSPRALGFVFPLFRCKGSPGMPTL
eukprot:350539-Chlamydomonas_euryale.AAC.5